MTIFILKFDYAANKADILHSFSQDDYFYYKAFLTLD